MTGNHVDVSIVVVNYSGARFLPALLEALRNQTATAFELVFIDNDSRDDSVAIVEDTCREYGIALTLVVNDTNLGFAPACAQGCSRARGAWIATLNNDTIPEPDWLEQLLACAVNHPGVGMVASKMLFQRDTGEINSAGIAMDGAGIAWDWRGGEADIPDEHECHEVFGPCAGAALYDHSMLDAIGGFDGDFFAYLEDVDLACRARLAGWICLYQPRARVAHVHSGTLGNASPFKNFLLGRNKVALIAKNFPARWLVICLPVIIAYDAMAVVYGTLTTHSLAGLRGRLAGLRGLPRDLSKRKDIQRRWRDYGNWRRTLQPIQLPWRVSRRYAHLAVPASGDHDTRSE